MRHSDKVCMLLNQRRFTRFWLPHRWEHGAVSWIPTARIYDTKSMLEGIGICNFILHLPKAAHSDLFLLPLCAYNNFGLPYCHLQHYRHLCHITHNHFLYIEDPGRCYPLTKRKLLESAAVSSYWEIHRLYNRETYRLYNHSLLPLSFQKALELLRPSSTFCTLLDLIH